MSICECNKTKWASTQGMYIRADADNIEYVCSKCKKPYGERIVVRQARISDLIEHLELIRNTYGNLLVNTENTCVNGFSPLINVEDVFIPPYDQDGKEMCIQL